MRNTIYRQMVFCIDTYRTWIEVADDNLYKEHVISRNTRTDFLVTRTYCGPTNRMVHTKRA